MRTKERLTPERQQSREVSAPAPKAHIPNSAMLAMMDSGTVHPEELEALPGQERRLDRSMNEEIEARLGARLPGLRVFEDEGLKEQYGQRAYARGNEIHVARGEYAPNTGSGRELIMHEAAHVVQQGSGMARGRGVLHDPVLEARAHAGVLPDGFIMPTAAVGNPIQGWNPFKKLAKSHRKAVDDFNNNEDSYRKMSAWDRFKWSVKNPLARMTASSKARDTDERNADRERKRAAMQNYDFGNVPTYDHDADPFHRTLKGQALAEHDLERTQGHTSAKKQANSGLLNLGVLLGTTKAAEYTGDLGDRGLGAASGAVGVTAAGIGLYTNVKNADYARKTGNYTDAAAMAMGAVGNIATGSASALKLGANALGTAANVATVAGEVVPGANVIAGGLQAAGGAVKGASATHSRTKLSGRMEKLKGDRDEGQLTENDKRLYRTMEQAREMAKVRQVEGAFDVVGGGMNAVGGVLTLTGAGAGAGLGLSLGSVGVGMAKGAVTKRMKSGKRKAVVNEELDLDAKIKQVMDDGVTDDKSEAKHLVLKHMGIGSGKRKEAFGHITMQRAAALHTAAAQGDEESAGVISDMGLHKTKDGSFSLQGVAEKLGMEVGVPWQKQMEAVSQPNPNPFAAKERRKKRQNA